MNPNTELGFLRRVITAENPRVELTNLVRAHQMPAGFAEKYAASLKPLMTIFCLNSGIGWAGKLGRFKQLQPQLPAEVFTPVAKILIERYRVNKGEIPDPMLAATAPTVADKEDNSLDLEASLAEWESGAGQRKEEWERRRLLESLGNLSSKQLIKLVSKNSTLFDANETLDVDGEEYKLAEYLKGWASELKRLKPDDKEDLGHLKREIIAVAGDFINEFSKEERELLWREIHSISHQMLGSRGRRRSRQQEEDESLQLSDEEFFGKFEEARAKLPLTLQSKLAALPNDRAMLQLAAWLRHAAKLEPGKLKLLGLNKGDFVLRYEWLDALESKMRGVLYQRLLSRARTRLEKVALARWRQLQALVISPMPPETEEYLYNQLRLVVEKYEVFKELPERIHCQVYGTAVRIEVSKKSKPNDQTEIGQFPILVTPLQLAGLIPPEIKVERKKTKKNKKLRVAKPKPLHSPQQPQQKPKGEKKYPPEGEAVKFRTSEAEYRQALSLIPRNKGVCHRKRQQARFTAATA